MSLSTLLEAAKFLELQEQKEQQRAAAAAVDLSKIRPKMSAPPNGALLIATRAPPAAPPNAEVAPNLLTLAQQTLKQENLVAEPPQQLNKTAAIAPQTTQPPRRYIHNSFDIMNPLVIDETGAALEVKRKQPPLVFRSGTREVHNKLEKHRRAHLKECFDSLKKQLPQSQDEKKTSNLSILHSALRFIQALKRKERELEHEMERLAREKIAAQQKLAILKKDIACHFENVDLSKILPEGVGLITTAAATTTGNNIISHNNNNNNSSGSVVEMKSDPAEISDASAATQQERILPILPTATSAKTTQIQIATTQVGTLKEVGGQPTALSVVPVTYPMSQGLVLQKLAIVPKGLTDLTPLVSTHFITQQQINGKVVPLVNAQYVVKPVVVVSRPS